MTKADKGNYVLLSVLNNQFSDENTLAGQLVEAGLPGKSGYSSSLLRSAMPKAALPGIETSRTNRKGQFETCDVGVINEIAFVARLFQEAA